MKIGILNAGAGSWVFDSVSRALQAALWVDQITTPADRNYVLGWEGNAEHLSGRSFVPIESIRVASDKRLIAAAFLREQVPAPKTVLCENTKELAVQLKVSAHRWALKYPTGSGASGHRMLADVSELPASWPTPYVLQEFIELPRPEVFRVYTVAGQLFGFNTRRFPENTKATPRVAHAKGARYVHGLEAPQQALEVARHALKATGLLDSLGCVDLLQRTTGEWLALEVGTDGIHNHIDREIDSSALTREWDERLARAFWAWVGEAPPWGTTWKYRE